MPDGGQSPQGAVAVSGEPPRWRLSSAPPLPRLLSSGLDHVVHEQQLGDRQRLAALAAVQLAQGFRKFGALAESGPDRLLEQPAVLVRHVPVDVQCVHGAAVLVAGQLEVHRLTASGEDPAQVWMPDGGPQQQFGRQRRAGRVAAPLDRGEPDDDVGAAALRPDVGLRFGLTAIELGEHLLPGVAALSGIAPDLPIPADLLGRIEVDGDVEARRGELGVQRQQSLDDHEPPRFDVLGPGQLAGLVVVDGLEDRVPGGEQLQLLLHDVDVIAVGVQRREPEVLALLTVITVVVIHANGRALLLTEGADQAGRNGRLAGRTVADDGEHDRPVIRGVRSTRPVHAHELVRHACSLRRQHGIVAWPVTLRICPSRADPPRGGGYRGKTHHLSHSAWTNGASRIPRGHLSCSVMERRPVRVVLVDDHEMVLEGLKAMLARFAGRVRVVGQAGSAEEAQPVVTALSPDVVLCDVRLRGSSGLDLCRRLTEDHPGCRVLLLSVYDDEQYLYQALRAGASGYLLKRVTGEELVKYLEQVHAGETVVDATMAARVATHAARLDKIGRASC